MIINLILFCFLLLFLYLLWITRRQWYSQYRIIPGPRDLPILGHALEFMVPREKIWDVKNSHFLKYKRIVKLQIVSVMSVNLIHPDDVEALISNSVNNDKSYAYGLLHPWLGTGLLTSTGQKWHTRRKFLTPAFHFNILKYFAVVLGEQGMKLVKRIRSVNEGSPINVVPYTSESTLQAMCETSMGISVDHLKDKSIVNYQTAIHNFGEIMTYRIFHPWLLNEAIMYNLSKTGGELMKVLKVLHKFTRNIINKRLENWDESTVKQFSGNTEKKRLAMLDLMIAQKKEGANITIEGICEEVDTFMFEGHDTTSVGISFTLFLLANHRTIQDRAYDELKRIFGNDKVSVPTYEQLQEMVYLEMCIKESLRLYPPVHILGRMLTSETELAGYKVPAGCNANVHVYNVHRHPEFWPNPDVFDPDRFLPENCNGRHPFCYIPFSAGPRNCIGQRFAMLELKTAVSGILRNFILEPVTTEKDIVILTDIILRVKDGIKIKFCDRT